MTQIKIINDERNIKINRYHFFFFICSLSILFCRSSRSLTCFVDLLDWCHSTVDLQSIFTTPFSIVTILSVGDNVDFFFSKKIDQQKFFSRSVLIFIILVSIQSIRNHWWFVDFIDRCHFPIDLVDQIRSDNTDCIKKTMAKLYFITPNPSLASILSYA